MIEEEKVNDQGNILNQDQRRCGLLNDPNYGIVLAFMERFRSVLDLPTYPYQRLEDHLLHTDARGKPDVQYLVRHGSLFPRSQFLLV
jgi:hypothetical protein